MISPNINSFDKFYLFIEQTERILTDNGNNKLQTKLFNALLLSYSRYGKIRILLPIITHFDNNMIYKLLPAILVQLNKDESKEIIGIILKNEQIIGLNASNVLVEIQYFAPTETSPHIEKIITLTNYCLEIFTFFNYVANSLVEKCNVTQKMQVGGTL